MSGLGRFRGDLIPAALGVDVARPRKQTDDTARSTAVFRYISPAGTSAWQVAVAVRAALDELGVVAPDVQWLGGERHLRARLRLTCTPTSGQGADAVLQTFATALERAGVNFFGQPLERKHLGEHLLPQVARAG